MLKKYGTHLEQKTGEYHDLYVQSDTTLLADIFESFRDKCIEIYELDLILLTFYLSRISIARMFKKDQSRIRIID